MTGTDVTGTDVTGADGETVGVVVTRADGETAGVVVTMGTRTTELLVVGPAGVTAIEVTVEVTGTIDSVVRLRTLFPAKAAGGVRLDRAAPTVSEALSRTRTPRTLQKLRTVFFP